MISEMTKSGPSFLSRTINQNSTQFNSIRLVLVHQALLENRLVLEPRRVCKGLPDVSSVYVAMTVLKRCHQFPRRYGG